MEAHPEVMRDDQVRSVVDLGAAPGGWSQVIAASFDTKESAEGRNNDNFGLMDRSEDSGSQVEDVDVDIPSGSRWRRRTVVAVDRLSMAPIHGVHTLKLDFLSPEAEQVIPDVLRTETGGEGEADMILSDMMSNMTGNRIADIESSLDICRAVLQFAEFHLRPATPFYPNCGVLL
jgi:23S rRNA (uridine2552-2'-O)-methyltransferase